MPTHALSWISAELQALETKGLRRSLEPLATAQGPVVEVNGRLMVNFCSNDYLGLAADPRVRQAAIAAVERWGAGSGAARLIAGDLPVHRELEQRLARLKGTEAALLFSSGYHANAGVIRALVGRDDTVFADVLNHASILDGCLLSRAQTIRYRHVDTSELDKLLTDTQARRRLVVTDAVFGMDGDAAPLAEITQLCERHGTMLYLDEAHSTGVLGQRGAGLAEATGLTHRVDVIMGTLGKALGSFGAFVCGSRLLIDWLISRCRTFIFTTALPPAACGAAIAALDVLEQEPERRLRLSALSARMKAGLEQLGFSQAGVIAPIFPVILGDEQRALTAARYLNQRGFFVRAIRPPTVPRETNRLRVSLSAGHTEQQVDDFLATLAEVLGEMGGGAREQEHRTV